MADQEESSTFGKADYDECVKFREFQQRLKDFTDAQQQDNQQQQQTQHENPPMPAGLKRHTASKSV